MERRSVPRYPANEPARVTVLGDTNRALAGRMVNLSGRGMRLLLDQDVPVGVPVRVDVDGTILLGEVCYCAMEGNSYCVGIDLEHALTMSEELAALMRGLLDEASQEHSQGKKKDHTHRH